MGWAERVSQGAENPAWQEFLGTLGVQRSPFGYRIANMISRRKLNARLAADAVSRAAQMAPYHLGSLGEGLGFNRLQRWR